MNRDHALFLLAALFHAAHSAGDFRNRNTVKESLQEADDFLREARERGIKVEEIK